MPSIDLQLNVDHTLPLSSLISEATENLSLLQHHWNGAKLTRCSAIFFRRCMLCVAGLAKLEKQQENRPCIFSRSSSATLGDPMWYFVVQISMTYCGRYSSLSADISLAVLADVWSVECLEATEVFTSRRAPLPPRYFTHRSCKMANTCRKLTECFHGDASTRLLQAASSSRSCSPDWDVTRNLRLRLKIDGDYKCDYVMRENQSILHLVFFTVYIQHVLELCNFLTKV